jgi:uncharacterized protein YbaP (TraB family)
MVRTVLALTLLVLAVGCGRSHPFSKADMEKARQALDTALSAWKQGKPVASLKTLPEPIEFAEEMPAQGMRLLDFQVLDSQHTDADAIRFRVKLQLQDRRNRQESRDVTYAVGLKSPVVIGRDPYF